MSAEPTVFIADDDAGERSALRSAVESAGLPVEAFASVEEFAAQFDGGQYGCLVLRLRRSAMSELQLLEIPRPRDTDLLVITICDRRDVAAAVSSMKLGAVDVVETPLDLPVVLDKTKAALAQARALRLARAPALHARARLADLTPRERELLRMVLVGKSTKRIAAAMGLSPRTVSNHRAHLLAKTGAENTADLVRLAVIAGLASPPGE